VNFANGVVGAGIVGLPAAMNQAGLPLGVAMCVGVAVVSQYTIRLLAAVGTAQGTGSYVELAQRAYGPLGYYACSFFQFIFSFGAMVTYMIIFKDTMPLVLAVSQPAAAAAPRVVLLVATLLVLLPLSLVRAFGLLARLGLLKLVATLFITFTVAFYASALRGKVESTRSAAWKLTAVHANYFPALGTISFAFVCHHQTFLVLGSLRNATPRRFALTTAIAIFGSFALSLTVAVAGSCTFYDNTRGDIFINYDAVGAGMPARALITRLHAGWLRAAGATLRGDAEVEVSGAASYAGEGLEALAGRTLDTPLLVRRKGEHGAAEVKAGIHVVELD
jgi:sodium-coupled neutral amino acid transporter 11